MRNLLVLVVVSTVLLVGAAPHSQSHEERILIGTTYLSLGMPKDRVISRLSEMARLQKLEGDLDSWAIWSPPGKDGSFVGHVQFDQGRLIVVNKEWYLEKDNSTDVEFASGIYGAIAEFINEGKRSCTIDARDFQAPQGDQKRVEIICGGKCLSITTGRLQGYSPSAQVSEGFCASRVQ